MPRLTSCLLLSWLLVTGLPMDGAAAGNRPPDVPAAAASPVEASPTLAPFQHVRFCRRYPADCRSNPMEEERIDLSAENAELLEHVNRRVNQAIAPMQKSYGRDFWDGWTIAPLTGDCNDYVVTKRHQLLESGLPAKALRLAVVSTTSQNWHLVLLVATTKGDLVLDNLTEAIVPWQSTDYHWLKIQSARDVRSWYEVKVPRASLSHPN
jgi:predicted transglutaminase-like cysteine proteinase